MGPLATICLARGTGLEMTNSSFQPIAAQILMLLHFAERAEIAAPFFVSHFEVGHHVVQAAIYSGKAPIDRSKFLGEPGRHECQQLRV